MYLMRSEDVSESCLKRADSLCITVVIGHCHRGKQNRFAVIDTGGYDAAKDSATYDERDAQFQPGLPSCSSASYCAT